MVKVGLMLAEMLVKKNGPRADGKMLNDIAFGSYNDKIKFLPTGALGRLGSGWPPRLSL